MKRFLKYYICLFALIIFCAACYAQKEKLLGHWNIIKIITDDTGPNGYELNVPFFEAYFLKLLKTKADSVNLTLNVEDSLAATKAAEEMYEEFKGTYFQLNGNGTLAASFQKGDVRKGKYSINEKEQSITFISGKIKQIWFYSFNNDLLQIASDDGVFRAYMKKD